MSVGTLKWKTTTTIETYSKGNLKGKILDKAWTATINDMIMEDKISTMEDYGWYWDGHYWRHTLTPDHNVSGLGDTLDKAPPMAWDYWLRKYSDKKDAKKITILVQGWSQDTLYLTLKIEIKTQN